MIGLAYPPLLLTSVFLCDLLQDVMFRCNNFASVLNAELATSDTIPVAADTFKFLPLFDDDDFRNVIVECNVYYLINYHIVIIMMYMFGIRLQF